jgi:hypothetical protein
MNYLQVFVASIASIGIVAIIAVLVYGATHGRVAITKARLCVNPEINQGYCAKTR